MTTIAEINPPKRPKLDHKDEAVIDLENSEDGGLEEEDVKLENQLRDAQADLDKIHEEMLAQLREVEQEYERRKAPFYRARGDVIKDIPGFWLHCFLQHQELKHVIGDADEQILSALKEIGVEAHNDPKDGYKLVFKFDENAWFEDSTLSKDIHFVSGSEAGPQVCYTTGSKPRWKKQDPTTQDPQQNEREAPAAPFISWLVTERSLEPGLVDTLADIIKDQLYVNPLEYLEAENGSEVLGEEHAEDEEEDDLLDEDLEVAHKKEDTDLDIQGDFGEGEEDPEALYDLDEYDEGADPAGEGEPLEDDEDDSQQGNEAENFEADEGVDDDQLDGGEAVVEEDAEAVDEGNAGESAGEEAAPQQD